MSRPSTAPVVTCTRTRPRQLEQKHNDKGVWVQDISEPAEGPTAAAGRAADVMGSDWTMGVRDIQAALETLGMQVMPSSLSALASSHRA